MVGDRDRLAGLPGQSDEPIEKALIRADDFYLLKNARVAGWGDNGQFVITSSDLTQAAVVGPAGIRRIKLPPPATQPGLQQPGPVAPALARPTRLTSAFFVEGRWLYLTSQGLITDESTTPIEGTADFARDGRGQVLDGALVLMSQPTSGRIPGELRLAILSDGKWERYDFHNLPGHVQCVVRLRDGGLLGVGLRIRRLAEDMKSAPTESELTAALDAARKQDTVSLNSHLSALTAYSSMQLHGLATRLQEIAGRLPTAEDRTTSGPAISTRTLGQLIGQGYQYYDGLWLNRALVIHQSSLREALLVAAVADPLTGAEEQSLLRVDDQGRLHKLATLDEQMYGGWLSNIVDTQGLPLVLVPGLGLGRLKGGQLEWLDRSNRMRSMTSLQGADSAGRIYLHHQVRSGLGLGSGSNWVFRPDGQARPAASVEVLQFSAGPGTFEGMGGRAVVDDRGRLWVSAPRQAGGAPTASLPGAKLRPLKIETPSDPWKREWSSPAMAPALYCREIDGQLYRTADGPGARVAGMFAGRGGALFLDLDHVAMVVQDDAAFLAGNLHQLAQEKFGRLLAAAPERTSSSLAEQAFTTIQCVAVGRILWVKDRTGIEAYADGKPLSILNRLKLLNPVAAESKLWGPLPGPDGPRMLIPPRPPGDNWIWATQKPDGIALDSAQPPADLQAVVKTLAGQPVLDYRGGRVYLPAFTGSIVEMSGPQGFRVFENAGWPVLTVGDKLLVRGSGGPLFTPGSGGFRLFDPANPSRLQDIKIDYAKPLTPVLAEEDGTLLCTTAEGLVWIRPDDQDRYRPTRSIELDLPGPVSRYLGRSPNTLYVATEMGTIACVRLSGPSPATQP